MTTDIAPVLATALEEAPSFRAAIADRLQSFSPTLGEAARHLMSAGGKGIRPRVLRLVAQAYHPTGRVLPAHEALAEAIEYVHVGSLIHDDILDEAATRRGVPSVHVKYDAKVAVLAGDWLMAQASRRVASLGDPVITDRLAETIADLCEGELLQDEQRRKQDVTMEAYLERVARKTSAPFELATEGAARISGANPRAVAVARRFGFHLGRLFQLVDDMLDWTSTAAELGKPVGRDLVDGTLTLPVLVALDDATTGPALRAKLSPWPTVIDDELRALVTAPGPAAETLRLTAREAERARGWLMEMPAGDARDEMVSMLDQLVAAAGLEGA